MNYFLDAVAWIVAGLSLGAEGPIWIRIGEHLFYAGVSVLIAAAIAIPLGYLIGHTGRGREIAVGLSGAARALPSFGLILLLVLLLGVLQVSLAAFIAFVVLAIPSILAGAYAGLQAIDRTTVESARALGMTEWQILWRVEVPLGLPLLLGGLRSAALQVVATATLAGYVGLGGLGVELLIGLNTRNVAQLLGSALLVVALALLLDAVFGILTAIVGRTISNGAVPVRRARSFRGPPSRRPAVVGTSTDRGKG